MRRRCKATLCLSHQLTKRLERRCCLLRVWTSSSTAGSVFLHEASRRSIIFFLFLRWAVSRRELLTYKNFSASRRGFLSGKRLLSGATSCSEQMLEFGVRMVPPPHSHPTESESFPFPMSVQEMASAGALHKSRRTWAQCWCDAAVLRQNSSGTAPNRDIAEAY